MSVNISFIFQVLDVGTPLLPMDQSASSSTLDVSMDSPGKPKTISESIDVVGTPGALSLSEVR